MKATAGMVVSMHYTLTDDQGEVIDSSRGGEPFAYLHGHGNIISGLEQALEGAEAGFHEQITVAPEDGYGEYLQQAVFEVPRDQFPQGEDIEVGMRVHGEGPQGVMAFTVVGLTEYGVILDGNHPLAGKTLHFDVEVLEVRQATRQELAHGHVHAGGHDH
ncbi:MAG TPA: peptidylprolyl isomerase [Candidatus Competibacteraceae bacterium]|nr:peptidylprolyl isomerase [Candidatus Competibacteraceae bacterium]